MSATSDAQTEVSRPRRVRFFIDPEVSDEEILEAIEGIQGADAVTPTDVYD